MVILPSHGWATRADRQSYYLDFPGSPFWMNLSDDTSNANNNCQVWDEFQACNRLLLLPVGDTKAEVFVPLWSDIPLSKLPYAPSCSIAPLQAAEVHKFVHA